MKQHYNRPNDWYTTNRYVDCSAVSSQTGVTADKSYLTHSLIVYIQSLTTASGYRLFGAVVEHWIFNTAAQVRIPTDVMDFFFRLLCYALFFNTAFTSSDIGLIFRRNGFQVIINDDFLEDGECYGR